MNCSRVRTSFSLTYFKGCWESKYASSSSIFSFSCAALANFAFWLKWSWCNFSILGLTLTVARAPCPFLSFVAFDYEILKNKIRKGRSKKNLLCYKLCQKQVCHRAFCWFYLVSSGSPWRMPIRVCNVPCNHSLHQVHLVLMKLS